MFLSLNLFVVIYDNLICEWYSATKFGVRDYIAGFHPRDH